MKIETRLNKDYQTIIPSKYIKEFNLEEGDIVQWDLTDNNEIVISFKKSNIFS